MKLPTNNANHIKVPLSCLKITDNVRMNFDEAEIEELANSIRQNGLMNPITVRPPETDADGNKTYEVIAGGRRIRAHQWLCEHGDDFSLIECCMRTGDKWALQMIENIQRTDLTPREKENAVAKALEEGLTQTQIADKLSKPIQWVSDIVAGAKIRKIADEAGLNTEEITTKTLSQLRSIPEEKLVSCLTQLIAEGGTYRAATRMMQEEKNPATTRVSTMNETLPIRFKDDDESMISPTEMSEKDFHDDVDFENENEIDEERERKEQRFIPGTEIDKIGERLHFADLWMGRNFILPVPFGNKVEKNKKYIVAQVTSFNGNHTQLDCYWWTDERDEKGHNVAEKTTIEDFLIDSEVDVNSHWWIYEIPDDAVAVKVPDMQPVKTETGNTQSKGGISLRELNKLIVNTSFDEETKVEILFYGKMFSVFSASFDKKNNRLILAHDPYDSELPEEKSKGVKNPISKQIQTRWQVFCKSKKIAESEKTAFAFYQELAHFFEDTYKD